MEKKRFARRSSVDNMGSIIRIGPGWLDHRANFMAEPVTAK